MELLVLALVLHAALAQEPVDVKLKNALKNFFGSQSSLEEVPANRSSNILDWLVCQCVPHYLCDTNNFGVDVNNASITGWGGLSIRSGDAECEESIDICCIIPKGSEPPELKQVLPKGCGYRNLKGIKNYNVIISGATGMEAQFGESPWVILLTDTSGSVVGTGVLIHPEVVMTAAHIVFKKFPPGKLRARAGEWDMKAINEILSYQERDVQEIYLHKDYKNRSLNNDVALLKLAEPFRLEEHINVICLPDQDESFDGSKCMANGWGMELFDLQSHNAVILKRVDLEMIPHSRCNDQLKRTQLGTRFRLLKSFVCAQGRNDNDICEGDGGAPLVCPIGTDRYKLIGLAAWSISYGQNDVPGAFANVPMFRRWIEDQLAVWKLDISGSSI